MPNDYYSQREKVIRERWFKDHVSAFETQGNLQVLTWSKPGTSNYRVNYIIQGRYLLVCGDAGDAIYGWSQTLTWEWLAGLELGYFASKCCASEEGSRYREWVGKEARKWIDDYFSEHPDDKAKFEELCSPGETLSSGDAWTHWLVEHGYDVFGDDYGSLSEIGCVHAIRCQGHLLGIQMAMERKPIVAADEGK